MTKNSLSEETRKRMEAHDAPGEQMVQEARDLLGAGDVEGAEQKCRQAMKFFQGRLDIFRPHELMGDILLAKGEHEEALQQYEIVSRNGDSSTLFLNIALCYVRLGDLEKSREALRACADEGMARLGADPPPKGARSNSDLKSMEVTLLALLGNTAVGGYGERLKYYKAAAELEPENWGLAQKIGSTLDDLKRYDEAIPYYKRALELGGDKVSDRTRTRVEMYNLQQNSPVAPSAPR